MACLLCPVEPNIVIHWYRNRAGLGGSVPIRVHSHRADAFQQCVRDPSSQLYCFKGLEQAILPLIAAYCGLAAILPCSCCCGAPFRYCGQQAKLVQVGPITARTPGCEEGTEGKAVPFSKKAKAYQTYLPMPLTLYQVMEEIDFLYHSEQQPFSHDVSEDWDWTAESYEKLKSIPWWRNGGAFIQTCGDGYLVCTAQGIYSNNLNLNWESLCKYTMTCDRTDQRKGHQYSLSFKTREQQFTPYTKEWSWEVEDENGNREQKTIELKAFDKRWESTTFIFQHLDKFQKFMRIVLTKLQKPLEYERQPYYSRKTVGLTIVQNSESAQIDN
jgi:hypothetical protein